MRRSTVFIQLLIVLLFPFLSTATPLVTEKLTCEYLVNPLGIDTKFPRFAWTFKNSGKNEMQTAFEIIINSNQQEIQKGKGREWSSGKITSSQNIQVVYNGSALKSFTHYYWRIKTYDKDGVASIWSPINWFETAMLSATDWSAKWIEDGKQQPVKDEDYYKPDAMPLFRSVFTAKKKISLARLYISGVGYYEAYLNGNKISDHVLDPGWTAYSKEVFYVVHDITPLLKKGKNTAGILLGNGWWNPLPIKMFGRWQLRDYQQTGRPCVKAEIHIRYSDGSIEKIITDEHWSSAPGPVLRNNVYLGEHYDAQLEQKDWLTNSENLNGWTAATIAKGPSGELVSQMQPAIKVTKIIKPIGITEAGKDTFIVNMGQNFAGAARLKLKGPKGTKITLRYGEDIFKNGRINLQTAVMTQIKKGGINGGPGAPETAWQEDSYTLKGEGVEEWSPKFTFHGFQYVELTGWPGVPTVENIEGLRMNSDLPLNGNFSCSNVQLTKLHNVIQWTFLSNVFSVQSDCPGREKMGYGADMVVSSTAFIYNYDMSHFYHKSIRDFANEQRPKGGMTEIAPSTGINDRGYADSTGPLGWQLAYPLLQKKLYDFYGDIRIIKEQYPALQRQIAFIQTQAVDNLFYIDISDHEALDPKPESLSASAFYYEHVMLAKEFATILNKPDDTLKYNKLAKNIKRSIVSHFMVPNTGRFDNATQSAQLFALWHDLTPDREKSFEQLLKEFERHNWHLSTGIFSTEMLFDVLRMENRNDIAYKIATQPDYPGWFHMINSGANTLWESWQFPETGASRNHPMFGSIDEWFYRSLLGINSAAAGFEKICIKPQPTGDLRWAKGYYESIRGRISSDWKMENGKFQLSVIIPANTIAEIWIPSKQGAILMEGDKVIQPKRIEDGYALVDTGSGSYDFTSSVNPSP